MAAHLPAHLVMTQNNRLHIYAQLQQRYAIMHQCNQANVKIMSIVNHLNLAQVSN